MRVIGIPALADNYSWLLVPDSGDCAVVDPSEARPILDVLDEEQLSLGHILATHHHQDHIGGIGELVDCVGPVHVYCSERDAERVPRADRPVRDGERIELAGTNCEALLVPGHTLGSVAWHLPGERLLFTGDTLFGAGCGRLFEGSAKQMHESLTRLRSLPDETRVYCGHEYTLKNLSFALELDPDDERVNRRLEGEQLRTKRNEPTIPSTIGLEKQTNPFLRADAPSLMRTLGTSDPVSTFARLRERRDVY